MNRNAHFLASFALLASFAASAFGQVQWVIEGGAFRPAVQAGQVGAVGGASGTTAQRPSAPFLNDSRWNTTTGKWEVYNGSTWINHQGYDADLDTWAGVTPGTGIATALAVNVGTAGAPVILNGAGGTPSSVTLTNGTGLPIATGVSGLGTGIATFLATPTSANLAAALTDEVGNNALAFSNSPQFTNAAFVDGAHQLRINASDSGNYGRITGGLSNGDTLNLDGNPVGNSQVVIDDWAYFSDVTKTLTLNGAIELGHASDTTIARSDAGQITVEGLPVILDLGCSEVDTSQTTTSGTPVDLATADSVSFTLPAAATVEIFGDVEVSNNVPAALAYLTIDIDGADSKTKYQTCDTATGLYPHTILHRAQLSAGPHTVKLQHATNAGTLTVRSRTLTCKQM